MSKYPVLNDAGRDLLFRDGRSHNGWRDESISEETLRAAFDLAKMGPTSANCSPMRVLFVRSEAAKEKLRPCLSNGNQAKTLAAPVTAILGVDFEFYEHLPRLFPHDDAKAWFVGDQAVIDSTATRNGSLQGAYFLLACRAVGLDCGPMSGYDGDMVDELFFAGTKIRSNFLCNLGHGDPDALFGRSPRFDFDDVCTFV
jgi:3-hydroxypropanoate dehydrogenase